MIKIKGALLFLLHAAFAMGTSSAVQESYGSVLKALMTFEPKESADLQIDQIIAYFSQELEENNNFEMKFVNSFLKIRTDAVDYNSNMLNKTKGFSIWTENTNNHEMYHLFPENPLNKELLTSQDHLKLIALLKAAENDDHQALSFVAERYVLGLLRVLEKAIVIYRHLADLGDTNAQYMVGLFMATGITDQINISEALLYLTLASENGNEKAHATLGNYYDQGIGVMQSCSVAVNHYRFAAKKSLEWYKDMPLTRRNLILNAYHYDEEFGGLYGPGASIGDGFKAVTSFTSEKIIRNIDQVIDYMSVISQSGEIEPYMNLAILHYYGSKTTKPDYEKAFENASKTVKLCWSDDEKFRGSEKNVKDHCGSAATLLGRLYIRGEGVKIDYDKAHYWFQKGASLNDSKSLYYLGLMAQSGIGRLKNEIEALKNLEAASKLESKLADIALGKIEFLKGNFVEAFNYFSKSKSSDPEAIFFMAEMARRGFGVNKDCATATRLYKKSLEMIEGPIYDFKKSNKYFNNLDLKSSLILQLSAAEMAHEAALYNVAYLLDNVPFIVELGHKNQDSDSIAFKYYSRSARQFNTDSLVRVGDFLLAGRGYEADPIAAYEHYQIAATKSAQAAWNLGWMHENGIGVKQDYTLSKYFYKIALSKNNRAYLPVFLSLIKLNIRIMIDAILQRNIGKLKSPNQSMAWSSILKAIRKHWIGNKDSAGMFFSRYSESIYLLLIALAFLFIKHFIMVRQNRQNHLRR